LRQVKGHGTQFGRKKEAAITALLTQRNMEEAARATGVAPNTLLKWLKLPAFQAAYREARRDVFGQAVAPAAAGNLGSSDHFAEDDDRSGHAGVSAGTGGRGHLPSRGQGH